MPEVLGWDDGERPLLLEDLRGCVLPAPWDDRRAEQDLDALARLRATDGGALTPLVVDDPRLSGCRRRSCRWGWRPSAGCETAGWCLAAAAEGVELDGSCPTHLDVRSDTICFRDRRALLVD